MNRMTRLTRITRSLPSFAVVALLSALAGCGGGEEQDPSAPKTSLAVVAAGELNVELLAETRLETGKTPVYVKVTTASGQVVTDATVTFTPMMSMMDGKNHSAPVIGPPVLGADGLYRCDVVFQMASGASGSWSATVGVTRPGAAPVSAAFPSLTVADSGCARTFSYTEPGAPAATRYVVSMDFVGSPRVGLNPVVVTLFRMQDMMTFVPVDDAAFALDPQMPSMGHGSPGSVNPTLVSPGVYEGQLSFSMAGDWETTVTVTRGGVTLGAPKFVTFF